MKHFLTHNDEARLDPVRIVKSLAFQLAHQLPAVAEHILGLDVKEVDQLRDMDVAYKLLIQRAVTRMEDQKVIILIDALDEGDPDEQQRAGYDRSKGFKPVGNKVTGCLYGFIYGYRLVRVHLTHT